MTTNFAGESREETDFLKSKMDIWKSTLVLSEYLLTEEAKLENKEDMDNHSWWEHVRYNSIA
jgi:hypothetical protein